MKKYMGMARVIAEPACRVSNEGEALKIIADTREALAGYETVDLGYRVRGTDYDVWFTKDAFEETFRPVDGMDFGMAIEAVKRGERCRRAGWNGKNQHIELASAISYIAPDGTVVNAAHEATGNKAIAFCGTSGVQMGWLASQADMLAEDWEIVE